jgi:hypothetical protein
VVSLRRPRAVTRSASPSRAPVQLPWVPGRPSSRERTLHVLMGRGWGKRSERSGRAVSGYVTLAGRTAIGHRGALGDGAAPPSAHAGSRSAGRP